MEKLQRLSKVKLELKQPQIKCSGRKDITCFYRGDVTMQTDTHMWIVIKSHGERVFLRYDKNTEKFTDLNDEFSDQWNDLKLIQNK